QQKLMMYAPQATAMARRLGDPELIAYSLVGMFFTLMGPEHVEQRLAIATEMLDCAKAANVELDLHVGHTLTDGLFWRGYCLLELGDMAEADAEFDAWARLGEENNQAVHLSLVAMVQAMRALMQGRFEDSERLAQQAFTFGQRLQTENAAGVF